jgi:hypothetical protein
MKNPPEMARVPGDVKSQGARRDLPDRRPLNAGATMLWDYCESHRALAATRCSPCELHFATRPSPSFNYREIPLHPYRPVRLDRQRGVQQVANRPDPIHDAQRDTRRGSQSLMDAA